MKKETLLELAAKWEREGSEDSEDKAIDGSKEAEVSNAIERGKSQGKIDCASDLIKLVDLLG